MNFQKRPQLTMAGSGTGPVKGRQMGWLRHVLTVLSVLIFVSSQKQRQRQTLSQIRQGPRFSIRMVIGIFCYDTETGAVTPSGVMQKK